MQLSQFTDYALRTLILTALNAGRRTTIEEVATTYGISKEHVRKVVHQLTRLGFLEGTRGRGGGIRLAMPAEAIRIGDVVRGTETNFAMAECLRREQQGGCPIDGVGRRGRQSPGPAGPPDPGRLRPGSAERHPPRQPVGSGAGR